MSVTYVIGFRVRQGQREPFLSLLNTVLDAMRHEAMFIEATLHAHPDDDHRFLLHETWVDHQDVLDVQLKREYRQEWHAALPDLLEGEREISQWWPLRADYKTPPGQGSAD
jgi:quinol monooxygenase YgiN